MSHYAAFDLYQIVQRLELSQCLESVCSETAVLSESESELDSQTKSLLCHHFSELVISSVGCLCAICRCQPYVASAAGSDAYL